MGAWSVSITGNDTAQDLYSEYTAAFYRYDVEEALVRIDRYVRQEMFDETDPEEWCNYYYSLADFMWKKGILTPEVRSRAIEMIDSGFGLELWAEAGVQTLTARKKALAALKEKLLSPLPPKKKIKPNAHLERILEDGDIVAVQLQTAGKPYTEAEERPLSEAEFHALDGKYVLMQLVNCFASWHSDIVPEVKDYWACFRLFDGIYDSIPEHVDIASLPEAQFCYQWALTSLFHCECSLFYFKRRHYKVLCNRKDLLPASDTGTNNSVFWSINTSWRNPDSQLVAAMGKEILCGPFTGSEEQLKDILQKANRYDNYDYLLSREENKERQAAQEAEIFARIQTTLADGGRLYGITFGTEIGVVTVLGQQVDHLYIAGRYRGMGFGARLLEYACSVAGEGAYMDVPVSHTQLLQLCQRIGLSEVHGPDSTVVRMKRIKIT